jgi:hypothetical protein
MNFERSPLHPRAIRLGDKETIMAEQMRPASKESAPNPAHSYERSDPNREAGQGRLDTDKTTPVQQPDKIQESAPNRSDPSRQVNAHEVIKGGERREPDHSMFDEETTDPELAPQDIKDPRRQRQPRTGGKGGTPDEGESRRSG